MKGVTVREEFIRLILFIVGIFIIIKLFIPIIKPVSEVADKNYMRINFYQEVIGKALPPFKIITDEFEFEDEDKQDLFPLILKYLTNIDLCNPKSYIASQIPGLNLIDISFIMTKEDEPIIITTNEKEIISDKEAVNEATKAASSKTENNEKAVNVVPDNKVVNSSVNEKPKNVDPSKPIVFIFHTHTTEAYNPNSEKDKDFTDYKEINKGNYGESICTVGEQLKSELENKYGISCIHDTTVHDYPRREGGYAKARPTIQKYLKQYPSIKLVIDLHRDGDVPKSSTTAIINNKSYARVLFVLGKRNPNLKINLSSAQKYHAALQDMYPGFSKGIRYNDVSVFNQDLFGNMILLELGSNFNTMSEALNTVKIIAKIIAADLK